MHTFLQILTQHPQFLERLESQSGTGYTLWDLQSASEVWISPGLKAALGYPSDSTEPRKSNPESLLAGGYTATELIRLSQGNVSYPVSLGFQKADGQSVWLKSTRIPLSDDFQEKDRYLLWEHELPGSEPDGDWLWSCLVKMYDQPGQTLILLSPDNRIRYFLEDGLDPLLLPDHQSRIGQSLSELDLPEATMHQILESLEEARLSDHTHRIRFQKEIKGRTQDFRVTVNVFRDNRRRPFWAMVLLEDCTEELETQRQLRHLESLISRMSDISVVCDSRGRITWANDAFAHSTGHSEFVHTPISLLQLCGPDMPRQEKQRLEEALQHCLQTTVEISRQTGPEPHYQIQLHLHPVFNEAGHCLHLVCSGRDVTRERSQEAFTETLLRLLRQTNREAGIGGWSFEPGSDKVFWSDEVFAIHETDEDFVPTVEQVIGFYDTEEARHQYFEAGRDALQFGIPYDVSLPIRTAKGNRIWVRVRGIPEMEDGQCVRLYGSIQRLPHPPGPVDNLPAIGPESLVSAG